MRILQLGIFVLVKLNQLSCENTILAIIYIIKHGLRPYYQTRFKRSIAIPIIIVTPPFQNKHHPCLYQKYLKYFVFAIFRLENVYTTSLETGSDSQKIAKT